MTAWPVVGVALLVTMGAPSQGTRAPQRLADTGLFAAGRPGVIDTRNRPFSPQYPLWSDGAVKSRWVYLPPGTAIDTRDVDEWDLPVGTKFWKEFAFAGRRVETRMLWKASAAEWVAATYVWNADGTEAMLAPDKGLAGVTEVAPGRRHSLPSVSDCFACHGVKRTRPLGFTALQLSTDRDPLAIHGEPLTTGMVTLQTLADEGLLSPRRTELVAKPPRIVASNPQARAALGYLVGNCGTCHGRDGDVPAVTPFLKIRDLQTDGDAVARAMAGRVTTWQGPGHPEGTTRLVDPLAPDESAILLRMRSRRPSSQMPPLGTVLRDQAAIEAIGRWIATQLTAAPDRRALPLSGSGEIKSAQPDRNLRIP
jgi:cytochrome c553